MKKTLLASFLLLAGAGFTHAQTGFIDYDIEIKGVTPELNKGALLLMNSNMRLAYRDSSLRQDYKIGDLSQKTTILNKTTNQAVFMDNGMNGKVAVYGTYDQLAYLSFQDTTVTVELIDETKTIMGLVCKKAIMRFSSGEEAEYWYTEVFPYALPAKPLFHAKIPGVPLEFTTVANGYYMRFKCSNFGDTIQNDQVYFTPAIPRDYRVMDVVTYFKLMKEMQEKQNELLINPETQGTKNGTN